MKDSFSSTTKLEFSQREESDVSASQECAVQIIGPTDSWILERLARKLESKLPYAKFFPWKPKENTSTQIAYYVNYALYQTASRFIDVGYFTHVDESHQFLERARRVDYCVSMSRLYADWLKSRGVQHVIHIPMGFDSHRYRPRLVLGVVGLLDHPRKGKHLVDHLRRLPFVQIATTEGCVPDSQMCEFYQKIDYVLIPATIEGGPMSLLEGLGVGKPVIAPDSVGMIPEFEDSRYICRYRTGDPVDLERLVCECFAKKRESSRLVNGRSWDDWAAGHHMLFMNLLKSRGRTPLVPSPGFRFGLIDELELPWNVEIEPLETIIDQASAHLFYGRYHDARRTLADAMEKYPYIDRLLGIIEAQQNQLSLIKRDPCAPTELSARASHQSDFEVIANGNDPVYPKVYGLLITKDDEVIFAEWCDDQLGFYEAVVCLDGSEGNTTAQIAARYSDRIVYLHERNFSIPHKTDHGLRRIVHQEINRRFGVGHWIMCCHVDEFCYHDPRKIALMAERKGFDRVSWFSPHFYPHPDDLLDWTERSQWPIPERFLHYHWSFLGDGFPWAEDRLYHSKSNVEWDDHTHGSVCPHGLKNSAPFHPTYRHFKVLLTEPAAYERHHQHAQFKQHWIGQEHRTGLPFPVNRFEDLFVRSVCKYSRCDRFTGNFPHPWNMGDEYRPDRPWLAASAARDAYRTALERLSAGDSADARGHLEEIQSRIINPNLRALIENDLATFAALEGDEPRAVVGFRAALQIDPECSVARANLESLGQAVQIPLSASNSTLPASARPIRVAILSFLFNWPSTGGGIVHTVELAKFLADAGYEVTHFYARHLTWGIGDVREQTLFPSKAIEFEARDWHAKNIQNRFRQEITQFKPDYVIITDSWNFKPLLAEAVSDYPYFLRLQAMECLCPLNNVRLLPLAGGKFQQCTQHQLATPAECSRCLQQRGQTSGSLHQAERALSGVGSTAYQERLLRAFANAEAVLVVNPLTEAMVSPFAKKVRVVTAGMDPNRFPWPSVRDESLRVPGKVNILFAGIPDEWMKGFHVLLEAGSRLWSKRRDFEILVTGESSGNEIPFIRFIGWQSQEQLPRYLRACDILVMPTIAQEALGRTAVEAMASGRPVVASRIGGLPFTVLDGATGLLCEPGDSQDLAEKLELLIDQPEKREQLGRAGRGRFEEHYTWPVIIKRHYQNLLSRHRT
jgi:glycosyltransferase involved in cell wall biosynthesis